MDAAEEKRRQCEAWDAEWRDRAPAEILAWSARQFPALAFATSLGLEDQALTDLIARHAPTIPLFTLDTGRLFPQTYDLLAATEAKYALRIRVFFPDTAEVETFVAAHGIDGFRTRPDLRKACCRARKVLPLRRALAGLDAWICGLRRGQSEARGETRTVAWDEANGIVKICPLAGWSEAEALAHVRAHEVPIHPLHAQGYPSIGCACCTRAVAPGEDPRSGRWWWEAEGKRECGLHRTKTEP